MINIAADNGLVVILDPIEPSSWLDIRRANGTAKAFAYGEYLGNRSKNFPNIIWMDGNDFQSWRNATDGALVQAVARGLKSIDSSHIHTVTNLDTSGVIQLSYIRNLFGSRKWFDLIPDQTHAVVTAGYDSISCRVGRFLAYLGKNPGVIVRALP